MQARFRIYPEIELRFESEYEFSLSCAKENLKSMIKFTLDNFEIADIKLESESIEKILLGIYKN